MAFDGAGNFTRLYNFQQDRDNGIKIMSARVDGEFDGIAMALGQTLLRSGVVAMAGTLLMGNNKLTGLASGLVGDPGLAFSAEATTGLWLNGVGKLSAAVQGTNRLELNTTGALVTGTLGVSGIVQVGDGAVGTPSVSFASDTNTGVYRIGADNIGITAGGTTYVDISTVRTLFSNQIYFQSRTAAAPGLRLASEATGLYSSQAGQLSVSVSGVKAASFDSGTLRLYGSTNNPGTLTIEPNGTSGISQIYMYGLASADGLHTSVTAGAVVHDCDLHQFRTFAGAGIATFTGSAITLSQPVSASGKITSTAAGSPTAGNGQIYLNGSTSNRLDFGSSGFGLPTFSPSGRSPGTKILLTPNLTTTTVDSAIGVDAANGMWFSTASWGVLTRFMCGDAAGSVVSDLMKLGGMSNVPAAGANAASAVMILTKDSGTSRSINAAGTINASGADYAEYMTKSPGCGEIDKGDVCGVDVNGQLTREWAEAKSFVVKSTDPAYVGGDVWGSDFGDRPICPLAPQQGEEEPDDDFAARDAAYQSNKNEYDIAVADFDAQLEAARQTVDRIAFSGQVPCNVTGSFNVGDYIIAQQDGLGIQAVALAESDISFAQYKRRIGKVWAVRDGRAWIDVQHG